MSKNLLAIKGQQHSPKSIRTACVLFIPFLTGVLPLLSHSEKLTEPHRQ